MTHTNPNAQHGYTDGCPHCPDGHYPSEKRTWAVWLGTERDGDGQPTMIHVARPNGAHVSEADADWVRLQLNPHLRAEP